MSQIQKLGLTALGLTVLAVLLYVFFGQERLPQIDSSVQVWVSSEQEDLLSKLSEDEVGSFRSILATQKAAKNTEAYEDYVLSFTAYEQSRTVLETSLYRLSDGTNDFVLRYPDGAEYTVDTRSVLRLLTSATLDSLFDYPEYAPTMTVDDGTSQLSLHCIQNGWQYKKIDNSLFLDGVIIKDAQTALQTDRFSDVRVSFSVAPQTAVVEVLHPVTRDVLFSGEENSLSGFTPPVSGAYPVRVTARWIETSYRRYFGECTYEWTLLVSKKTQAFFTAKSVGLGDWIEISVHHPENPQNLRVQTDMGRVSLFAQTAEDVYSCLLSADKEGYFTVTISEDEDFTQTETVLVNGILQQTLDEAFPLWFGEATEEQDLQLPLDEEQTEEPDEPDTEQNSSPEDAEPPAKIHSFSDVWNDLHGRHYLNKLWRGRFESPVDAEPLVYFGQRFVDQPAEMTGAVFWTFSQSTQVTASGYGLVVLVERLDYGGLSVCIDHGLGVKSWYYGFDEVEVLVGDAVTTASVLGTVHPPQEEFSWFGYQLDLAGSSANPESVQKTSWLE